mmetsp:Transcript_19246/g.32592  ORF Transcript_19246/g.32592 Transcript_19246/m.32592 type:complete len:132 (+) Transcript_19246:2940-3335(+)
MKMLTTIDFDTTDEQDRKCTISMPGYIEKQLARFMPQGIKKKAKSPIMYTPPEYGKRDQLTTLDETPPLSATDTKWIQGVVGALLFTPVICAWSSTLTPRTCRSHNPGPEQEVSSSYPITVKMDYTPSMGH